MSTEPTKSKAIDPSRRAALIKAASYASVAVALTLLIIKAWAWRATGSISLLSSLADSLLDLVASALTFWAVRFSLTPADSEHRFGHGKSEGLAAMGQALIIAGSGAYVCLEAIQRMAAPQPITAPEAGLAVMVLATLATLMLVIFQSYVSRRTGSVAISADALHYKADLLVNVGVIAAILATALTGWYRVDPIVGLAVALYILWGAFAILRKALDILLDREIPDEDRERIQQIALQHSDVHGIHDMKTRFGGSNYIIQFHLELNPQISLWRSHEILDDVEAAILVEFPRSDIIIHADPVGFPEQVKHYD